MPSQPRNSWRGVFRLRTSRPISTDVETGSLAEAATLHGGDDNSETGDEDTLALTRSSSDTSQTTVGPNFRDQGVSTELLESSSSINEVPQQHCGTGSERVLYLCAHAFMTWEQFHHEIVEVFPYHVEFPSAPDFLTLSYARNSGMSLRDAVMRHKRGRHCQAWEGECYGTANPVPHGDVSFQLQPQNKILWYAAWHIATQEVWRPKTQTLIRGRGPANKQASKIGSFASMVNHSEVWPMKGSSPPASKESITEDQAVRILAERLMSFDIYLCPHLDFFSPILRPSLNLLWEKKFAGNAQITRTSSNCSECRARIIVYVQGGSHKKPIDDIVIIISRVVGTGASAMEQEWLNASEIRAR